MREGSRKAAFFLISLDIPSVSETVERIKDTCQFDSGSGHLKGATNDESHVGHLL